MRYYLAKFFFTLCCCFLSGIVTGQSSDFLTNIGSSDRIYSEVLSENREFWVQMPRDYNEEGGINYPVLYLLDGGEWLSVLHAIMNAESPGFIPEMILVGISNQQNRTLNLTTSEVESRNGRSSEPSGGAEEFTKFIVTELIPYIDHKYPTTNYRSLVGHSYGGLFTLNMMLHQTEVFRNYIVIDPTLDWDNQKLLAEVRDHLHKKKFNSTSLFLAMANEIPRFSDELTKETVVDDTSLFSLNIRSNLEFEKFLTSQQFEGLRFHSNFYEHELHGTLPLIAMFDGLKWIYDWYTIKSPSKFNSPDTPIDEMIGMIEARTDLLSAHFQYPVYGFPEDLINMLGLINMDMGQVENSLEFFKLNKKYYPKSPNVYDSMADYYINHSKYEKALGELEKAYILSDDVKYQQKMKEIRAKLKN